MNKINKFFVLIIVLVISFTWAVYAYTAKSTLWGTFSDGDVIGKWWYNSVNKLIWDWAYSDGKWCSYSDTDKSISCIDMPKVFWEEVSDSANFDLNCEWRVFLNNKVLYSNEVTNSKIYWNTNTEKWEVSKSNKSSIKIGNNTESIVSIQKKCVDIN